MELTPEMLELKAKLDQVNLDSKTEVLYPVSGVLTGIGCATQLCHGLAAAAGWWNHPKTGEPKDRFDPDMNGCRYALIHSEVTEAFEGMRTNSMSDKLPWYTSEEEELADALIRIFDYAGSKNLNLAGAFYDKLRYNQIRADHKLENRLKEGGKAV